MKDDLLKKYNIVSMNDLLLNFEEVHKENQKLIKELELTKNKCILLEEELSEINKAYIIPKKPQISSENKQIIRNLRKNGLSYREISREVGWSIKSISNILNNKS